jgi:hypothetical protein
MRRYQFIPVSRLGGNSYEVRLREEMRSRLISNAGSQNAICASQRSTERLRTERAEVSCRSQRFAIAFVGVGSAIVRYPRQLQRINCNQSALRDSIPPALLKRGN